MKLITFLMVLCLAPLSWAGVEPFSVPERAEAEGFQDFFAKVAPGVWVSGQPSAEALAGMKEQGVTTVINLRTSQEMDNRQVVPYDEAQTASDLELEYVHIPQGGPDTPYSPAALEQVAAAIVGAEGKVLMHCTVAWRASHMWAAYLVAHEGKTVAEAMEVGKQMNMGGFPFAEFLSRDVSLEPASE